MPALTADQLSVTAQVIRDVFNPETIRYMHGLEGGDEILRLIVRDDIEGAGEKIVSALLAAW